MPSYDESLRNITLDGDASVCGYTGISGMKGTTDFPGKMYRFVKVTGIHKCGLAVAATDKTVGILQNKPQVTGAAATVGFHGISNLVAAGVITAGDFVAPDATGRGVVDAVNGKWQALTTTTVANELVSVLRVL
jgi:hypothetical protein